MLTKAPKGTKDVLPAQVFKWHYVEKKYKEVCDRFGFKEMRTPVFEHTELFYRSVGDTTDIVEKQMYTFDDMAGRSLTLRPEGTASIARAFVENKLYADIQPSKYWYEIPCYRYEKPQSGRLREFHQFGIEIFGTDNMIADTEVIALADTFLRGLGIDDLELLINNIGCKECREVYRKVLQDFLKPNYDKLCDTCKIRYEKNPMRILDCKSPECGEIVKGAPVMLDYLCDECRLAFEDLKKDLDATGVEYTVDAGIVRGLDYYTKTAFEFISGKLGSQSTVCGGGRYDYLIEELGGPPIPGVGFGLGIERLLMILDACDIDIPETESPDILVAFIGDEAKIKALTLLQELRESGFIAEIDSLGRNIKGQFKYANRLDTKYTVIIGEEELKSGKATLKDMRSGEQEKVDFNAIGDRIKE